MSSLPPSAAPVEPVPGPLRGWSRAALRLGPWRAIALLSLAACLLSLGLTQLLVAVVGPEARFVALLSSAAVALLVTTLVGALLFRLLFDLDRIRQQIDRLATHDELTGVPNRRHFMAHAQCEWMRSRRYGNDAAVLLIDADHFKRINDNHGQLCGDELLRKISLAVAGSLRQTDMLARFDGEELIAFLPQTDPLGAIDVAERIRVQVQGLQMPWNSSVVGTTVSIGVAPLRSELPSLDWMIHEAETALHAAKSDGRNCVRTLPFQPKRSGEAYPVNSR